MNTQETLIYRMINYKNLNDLLTYGIYCSNSQNQIQNYLNIGDASLIGRRSTLQVPVYPNGVLHDYVPFYFCPRSPMLYIIHKNPQIYNTLQSDIIYLVSSVEKIENAGLQYVFTDGHAYLNYTNFFNQKSYLINLDWKVINSNKWFNNPPSDPDRKTRKQAEFLVYKSLPIECLTQIGVYDQNILTHIQSILLKYSITLNVSIERSWYY